MELTSKRYTKRWMIAALSFVIFQVAFTPLRAQIGSWRAYMSYYEPQQIVKAGANDLFVRASNDLYQYNLTDHSITTYDKVRQLSDTYIVQIAWNQQAKRLIVVYKNSNIDLLDLNGNATNISSLYNKSMTQDKTVNAVYIYQQYAYLSANFGIVKVNMERAEIAESYMLNKAISTVAISDGYIYAKTGDGEVLKASLSANLIDFHNWTTGTAPNSTFFDEDKTNWNQYIETVKTLQPGGPQYNYFGYMKLYNGRLYSCGGGYTVLQDLLRPAALQTMDKNNDWIYFPDDIEEKTGVKYIDLNCLDIDPLDENHLFASGRTGLYEFKDQQFVTLHTSENSLLKGYHDNKNYVVVQGIKFDDEGNLWCMNGMRRDVNLLKYKNNGQWESHFQDAFLVNNVPLPNMSKPFFDTRGLLWFVNNSYSNPSVCVYNPTTDTAFRMGEFVNQDGISTEMTYVRTITEDLEHNIWVGTNKGVFVIYNDDIQNVPDVVFNQIKVPRNDGTDYADYLLSGVNISDIIIDGANRKWISSIGSGVYLISADNMQQLQHFTTQNSGLLSDNIESMAIDGETGEVFFGTESGLCSYFSDATNSSIDEANSDDIYAFPNPVVNYDGLIAIRGFSYDSDVKIITVNGKLVAQGKSNGGTFTWDGRDNKGRRVASGIYIAVSSTSTGKKSGLCKIAIIN